MSHWVFISAMGYQEAHSKVYAWFFSSFLIWFFGSYLLSITIAFSFIVSIFLCKVSHVSTSILSINSLTYYVQQLCWFSHFDNNDNYDVKSNDTSNDKRSQHLLSVSGQRDNFLNALQVWHHWNLTVILWSNIISRIL